jgi:hypothetical protein
MLARGMVRQLILYLLEVKTRDASDREGGSCGEKFARAL